MSREKPFKSIIYYPIDSILKEEWANNIIPVDFKVSYCQYGLDRTRDVLGEDDLNNIRYIPHGVNTKEYYPITDEKLTQFKDNYFNDQADKFIITDLNRNQQRKDIPRMMLAFREFKKIVPDSVLYLHMAMKDQGWDLPEVAKLMGFTSKEIIFPQNFGPNQGYPREIVNLIYNCSDVVVSTSLGEGFGLSWIEAMAAKVPVVMPGNTAMEEFITDDMGYLVDSGNINSLNTVLPNDNEIIRPLTSLEDMVDKLVHIYNNRDEAASKAENAYNWIINSMDWQKSIIPQWVQVFDEAVEELVSGESNDISFEKPDNFVESEIF
jgi:glycosyltransferase involved in cell wall biosynthesis